METQFKQFYSCSSHLLGRISAQVPAAVTFQNVFFIISGLIFYPTRDSAGQDSSPGHPLPCTHQHVQLYHVSIVPNSPIRWY